MPPPFITLEEHFLSSAILSDTSATNQFTPHFTAIPHLREQLTDLGPLRLSSMNTGHVSLQIISHAPSQLTPTQCHSANNQLATAIRENPTRFRGFATLPIAEPEQCANELIRCVHELGFVGALIDNHTTDGIYYDGSEYDILWSTAEELDVPIYIHPTFPTPQQTAAFYEGNFPDGARDSISTSAWGWHSDVATHLMRLFAAGVFDRWPRLKIVIGHFGEMLPFMLERVTMLSSRWGSRERGFREVWDQNVWITTSGVWSVDPMRTILRNTKVERVLYSVDYPFARNEWGVKWWEELEGSGLVTKEEGEMIAFRNAEKLLRVNVEERFDQEDIEEKARG